MEKLYIFFFLTYPGHDFQAPRLHYAENGIVVDITAWTRENFQRPIPSEQSFTASTDSLIIYSVLFIHE